ncbi:hypothetical protein IW16_15015 [Chryseobacterium vrystaatense]|uniref:Uncharacterized protein n=1 Tax=Chryseobacterium vrystaatense TaxID=307480 RepID=A0ABR4UKF3_9FLAO|nr:hypothetical protein IW16_15015 [Chryseobacterium vrystaatense]
MLPTLYAIWTATARLRSDPITAAEERATDLPEEEEIQEEAVTNHNVFVRSGKPDADAFIFKRNIVR